MSDEAPRIGGRRPYPAGTKIEIRNRFDSSWTNGFEIAAVNDDGTYRVVRSSDGAELPTSFDAEDVRRHRKNSMWWV